LFGSSLAFAAGPAGVKLDGTLGGAAQILAGPTYNISQNLGRLSGGNLYFSFQYFNVAANETAQFSTTSSAINNVISRVTGGFSSTIDGTISLTAAYGAPNFFFINPSGVTFTATAAVNVPAAFYVSTANYLKFSDGNFYSDTVHASTLSAAAPEAFGFLGANRATIQVLGSFLGPGGNGQFDVTAGDIVVDGQGVGAGIFGQDGNINLTAVGNTPIEVPLTGSVSVNDGTMTIKNGAVVATISDGAAPGGAVTLSAGTVTVDGAGFQGATGLETLTGSSQNAGAIAINAGGDVSILNGASVTTLSQGAGAAGAINISAGGSASIVDASLGLPLSASSGTTGSVAITAANILIDGQGANDAFIFTEDGNITLTAVNNGTITIQNGALVGTESDGLGPGGAVTLTGGTLTVDGAGFTGSTGIETLTSSNQSAGAITIGASSDFSLANGAILGSTTNGGAAGNVAITADGTASVTNGSIISVRGTGATATITMKAQGILLDDGQLLAQEGNIALTAFGNSGPSADASAANGNVTIRNGSLMQTQSDNSAPGGAIVLTGGTVTVDGEGSAAGVQTTTATAQSAGPIIIGAGTSVSVNDGALVSSLTSGSGSAGPISITTPDLTLAGQGFSGVGVDGVGILSETSGRGNAGDVMINVDTLTVQKGSGESGVFISTQADGGSTGSGGEITINAGKSVSVLDGGLITAAAAGDGNGGRISITTQDLLIQGGANSQTNTEITTDLTGSSMGHAGDIQVNVASLTIEGNATSPNATVGIASEARSGSLGAAGQVNVKATGAVNIEDGGVILTDTYSSQPAGDISVAAGTLLINGEGFNTGNGTGISSSTLAAGNAGTVHVSAGSLLLEGGDTNGFAGIEAYTKGSGAGGQVTIDVSGETALTNGSSIRSNTYASGNAGGVSLTSGSLEIDALGHTITETAIEADTYGTGNGGDVNVSTQSLTITGVPVNVAVGIESVAEKGSEGASGEVNVSVAGNATLSNSGGITTDSLVGALGKAGQVNVQVGGTLTILSDATISSSTEGAGNAGNVTVNAAIIDIQGDPADGDTTIQAASSGAGNAGDVSVRAGTLTIDGGGNFAGISSEVGAPGAVPAGAGGQVTVTVAGNLILSDGGLITSTSAGLGPAGDVNITADNIMITGGTVPSAIASQSAYSGHAGQITIHTGDLSLDNSFIDIANLATVTNAAAFKSGQITVFATDISLDEAQISAGSTGNVAASALDINYSHSMTLRGDSELATQANAGNGGPISVTGGGPLVLDQSEITTSVLGASGNGGNVDISVPLIVMNTAAIQANTPAASASGGDISIHAAAIVPSFQTEVVGGTLQSFDAALLGQNLIQAAAPDGVPGTLSVTNPTLDIGSSLLALTGRPAAPTQLGRSLCDFRRGSSLSTAGRGGPPASARDPLWVDAVGSDAAATTNRNAAPSLLGRNQRGDERGPPSAISRARENLGCPEK
jgi:filamentous hemagglutinin family protein